jgi:hypothetical protein
MHRRSFLSLAAVPLMAANSKPKVALIITEYRKNSHADVIAGRLLGGYQYYGKRVEPRLHAVSMFTDQVPKNDMSRDMAARHGVKIYSDVRGALTLGGDRLAVDGVVLIGEHGDYPMNEKGQKLYPRHRLFQEIVAVYEASGRAVPTFCDKHLSTDWDKAKWMYDASRRLKFPFLAGSSVPIAWRKPELEMPGGARIRNAVATAYGGKEAYGFHALESLQVMVERRRGGETGVASVQCLDGPAVWNWADAHPWSLKLMEAANARSEKRKPGNARDNVKSPSVFAIRYRDGLEAAVFILNGHIEDFNFAADIEGRAEPAATLMWLQPGRYYAHFSTLTHYIEELVLNRKEPYPVERTLLTTGILAAAMDSAYQKGKALDTPHLDVRYRAPKASLYNRGAVPPLEPES